MFHLPDYYTINDKTFKVMISPEEIKKSVTETAQRINKDFKGKKPLFIITLKGAMFFAVDLLREIELDCEIETISAKSYGTEMTSSGEVKISGFKTDITGKDILIIEDIVDSGLTLSKLFKELSACNPASISAAAFLSKPAMRKTDIHVEYTAMEIAPEFVVGYGLDYAEKGRQLPGIYVLDETK